VLFDVPLQGAAQGDKASGYILACQALAESDVVVES
jgi:hypothetical protein